MTEQYPKADRFVAAAPTNFRVQAGARAIQRVVIHITDGGTTDSNVNMFAAKQPKAKSAHYVVGRNGEIVQMVRHNDVAFHAHTANADSIGIEHVATMKKMPTDEQYRKSAELVMWLCDEYGIPRDRQHIQGHKESDPKTDHACPGPWDWDQYMALVRDTATQEFVFFADIVLVNSKPANPATDKASSKRIIVGFTVKGKLSGVGRHPLGRNRWNCETPAFINLLASDTHGYFWYDNNEFRCFDRGTTWDQPAFLLKDPPQWHGDNAHLSTPGQVLIVNPGRADPGLVATWTRKA